MSRYVIEKFTNCKWRTASVFTEKDEFSDETVVKKFRRFVRYQRTRGFKTTLFRLLVYDALGSS